MRKPQNPWGLLPELDEFERKHPEINPAAILTCFHLCQGRYANSLEEAYNHVYKNPGGCSWCQEWIERKEPPWYIDHD